MPSPPSEPVTLLVVGAGSRGTAYADYARRHPEAGRVVAVAEPRAAYRARLAALHGLPEEACFADWREVASGPPRADAVLLATPDGMHAEPAAAFAAAGYAILLEKPLASTEADCRAVVAAARASPHVFAVAHVLRYTPYTRLLKALLDDGAVGEVMSVQHLEPVGFWHQAHSYVRGNWGNGGRSSPMLLAKSCHDFDWLGHVIGRRCTAVSSFGALSHLRPERRPAGAADRCLDCALEPGCAYSAPRLYLEMVRRGETGWPVDTVAMPPTEANVTEALRSGPYGRCVWACDNDAVDHQVVSLEYEGGATATFTMTAFTRQRDRVTRVFGTEGELAGDGETIEVYDFLSRETTRHETGVRASGEIGTGHSGGDDGLMAAFLAAVAARDPALVPTSPGDALESHLLAFAAERARHEGRVVRLAER